MLGNTIQRSELGSRDEKGLLTLKQSIQRARNSQYPYNKFFRSDAALSVIVISDEGEKQVGVSSNNFTDESPNNILSLVNSTWPGKPFAFHSIVIKTGDVSCLMSEENQSYGLLS